jgi:hypothetical protein
VSRIPLRLTLAIAVTALSLTLLAWSLPPPTRAIRRQSIQPTQMQLPTPLAVATQSVAQPLPAVPETRSLSVDYPPAIRAGEADLVRLTVEMDKQVVGIPNVYDTHDVLAEARLEMGGIQVRPPDTVSEPLLPGQSVTFFWSVQPNETGRFKGTLWFYLRFVPKNGGPETRQAISAQEIEIESTTLFGLRAEAARGLGLAGAFFSTLLDLPFLIDALKWLWKKCAGLFKSIHYI